MRGHFLSFIFISIHAFFFFFDRVMRQWIIASLCFFNCFKYNVSNFYCLYLSFTRYLSCLYFFPPFIVWIWSSFNFCVKRNMFNNEVCLSCSMAAWFVFYLSYPVDGWTCIALMMWEVGCYRVVIYVILMLIKSLKCQSFPWNFNVVYSISRR